jgi:alkanesulfonate monooxygenase SsuD/methylene tetrahydromethanopterin reductase-like flavin-dependent oxidoreductase (luciferase family)
VNDKYNGNADATFRGGQSIAQLDPTIMISAMAAVTESVSFATTGNTTYIPVR